MTEQTKDLDSVRKQAIESLAARLAFFHWKVLLSFVALLPFMLIGDWVGTHFDLIREGINYGQVMGAASAGGLFWTVYNKKCQWYIEKILQSDHAHKRTD